MKSLTAAAVAAVAFVHFKNPTDGTRLYVLNEDAAQFGAVSHEDGYARDSNGDKLPIGVKVYGLGSKEYRKAEDAIATARIQAGRKALTGATLREDGTLKLARTTSEFVNFEYNGVRVTPATELDTRVRVAAAFYDDVQFAGLRDQVETEQNDLGNFTLTASAN
jgi:hypothetical protein